MATVHDVAQYIVEKTGGVSTMKLQKLCYFANGWTLAWTSHPLFEEETRAWRLGPVVYDLYKFHRGEAFVTEWLHGQADKSAVGATEKVIIDSVIDAYQDKNGFEMGEESHEHHVWIENYVHAGPSRRGRMVMKTEDIRKEFEALDQELISGD